MTDPRRELDRGDRMCDLLLCTKLHTLGDPFQTISTTRQTTGSRVLTTDWMDDDVLEQEGLSEGCERFLEVFLRTLPVRVSVGDERHNEPSRQ